MLRKYKMLLLSALALPLFSFAGTELSIDSAGNLVDENGKILPYLGQAANHVEADRIRKFGKLWRGKYPDQYRWLYEGERNEEYFRRLGVNMLHVNTVPALLAALFPEYTPEKLGDLFGFYHQMLDKYQVRQLNQQWSRGPYEQYLRDIRSLKDVPVYADLQSSLRVHMLRLHPGLAARFLKPGTLAETPRSSATAIHFDLSNDNGRNAMLRLWNAAIDWTSFTGINPFAYKIFNEPSYENHSTSARKNFTARITEKYKNIAVLNRAWGTHYQSFEAVSGIPDTPGFTIPARIEFRKMNEENFAAVSDEIGEMIRRKTGKPSFLQLLGGEHAVALDHGCNIYLLHRNREIIVPGTGNFSFAGKEEYNDKTPASEAFSVSREMKLSLLRHTLYYPLAEGKPYLNTEAYVSRNRAADFRVVFWREIALGRQLVLFWELGGMDAPGKKKPVFSLLYPAIQPPQELESWKTLAAEVLKAGTLFTDRRNKLYNPEAGYLYSNSTLRRAALSRERCGLASSLDFIAALHFSYVDCAGVFEENLGEKLNKFKLFCLGNVTNLPKKNLRQLENYVRNGGTLFIKGALPADEYGRPFPETFLNLKFTPVKKTAGLIQPFGLKSTTTRKIECSKDWKTSGKIDGLTVLAEKQLGRGRIIVLCAELQDYALATLLKPVWNNAGIRPFGDVRKADSKEPIPNIELFAFRTPEGRSGKLLFNHNSESKLIRVAVSGNNVHDPVKNEKYSVNDGYTLIMLSPMDCAVLVEEEAPAGTPLKDEQQLRERLKQTLQREMAEMPRRPSDPVNLSKFANSGFDNAQKWAADSVFRDDSHTYLRGVPFGQQAFGNVVFDMVRFDYNFNRVVIALKSTVNPSFPKKVTVPVDHRCGDIMLLLSSIGGKNGEPAMRCRLNYADGSHSETTLRKGIELPDWKLSRNPPDLQKRFVWTDSDGNGLSLIELHNPYSSKLLESLEFISEQGGTTPVIAGISLLKTIFQKEYKHSVPLSEVFPRMVQQKNDGRNGWFDGELRTDLRYAEITTADNRPSPYLDTPEKINRAVLRGSVRIDCDDVGKYHNLTWFTICLPDSKVRFMTHYDYMSNFLIGKTGRDYVEFEIPLKLLSGDLKAVSRLSIFPGRQPGIVKHIRDFRLEW